MLSKIFITIFSLYLVSVLIRLRRERLESEYESQQRKLSASVNQQKKVTNLNYAKQAGFMQRPIKKLKGKYAAVSIAHSANACAAVKEISGQRFLAKDAPLMPLKQCPRRNVCNCSYRYHSDRRKSDEKSDFNMTFGIIAQYEEGENKKRRWYDKPRTAKAS